MKVRVIFGYIYAFHDLHNQMFHGETIGHFIFNFKFYVFERLIYIQELIK